MASNDQRAAPIGREAPKSPAERIQQIQLMQAQAQAAAPAVQATLSKAVSPSRAPDRFAIEHLNAASRETSNRVAPDALAYSKAQRATNALFGTSNDIEVVGNPWKVIPFGDGEWSALFDGTNRSSPVLPNKAVKTDWGALFEIGMSGPDTTAPLQKRVVLVNEQGLVAGAECRTPQEVTRLLSNASWLLPASAKASDSSWKVSVGANSAFVLEVAGSNSVERVALNNFGLMSASDLIVANYYLDRFESSI